MGAEAVVPPMHAAQVVCSCVCFDEVERSKGAVKQDNSDTAVACPNIHKVPCLCQQVGCVEVSKP